MDNNLIQLDCTLRDGGYYTNWDFSEELIKEYLHAISQTSIKVCEIGFRTLKNESFRGPLAFSKDEFLSGFNIPKEISLCVMINGIELKRKENRQKNLEKLFPNSRQNSPISIVRIACDIEDFAEVLPVANWLKEKGFKVGFNLMKISEVNEFEIENISKLVNNYPLDVFYFADSLGALTNKDIVQIIKQFKKFCNISLGCHLHDNLGLALSNSIIASNIGVNWIDTTITGMGRGPGNCKTEEFLIENGLCSEDKILKLAPIFDLIENYFLSLKEKYKWGTNSYYYLAGKYKIHPSYIQKLLSQPIYSGDDRINLINKLRDSKAIDYKPDLLTEGLTDFKHIKETQNKWESHEIFKNKKILILATGPSAQKYKKGIEIFIKETKPIVIALNTPTPINLNLIDIRAACHPIRMLKDVNHYKTMNQLLMCPYSNLEKTLYRNLNKEKILDYGLNTKETTFEFNKNYCVIPKPLVLIYTIAALISGEAKSIDIVGIDGYPAGDQRNIELEELLVNLIQSLPKKIDINSLTPTCIKCINSKSIFGSY